MLSMIKIGDKVRVITTDEYGTVASVYDLAYLLYPEITVNLDNGRTITVSSSNLTVISPAGIEVPTVGPVGCECGVKFVRHGGKHSDYCPLSYLNDRKPEGS